ncbi:YybH family protein [Gimesia algae]|uniref:SnoaL-like domain protein n=1 Tax=Gimesia algae TaxID=2527971 RepID=A0A517VAW5_9PLAN|nr:SgcJ/EcaC family oxidoreductase [Gimesia algae]QDT90142.1 SnoaL-like domain protein [Gimesia algae]
MNPLQRLTRSGLTVSAFSLLFMWDSSALQAQFQRTPLIASGEPEVTEPQKKSANSGAEAAVKKVAEQFKQAFDAGNAEKIASFWTPEGEYIESSGKRLAGRPDIQKMYTEYFKNSKGAKIQITIDAVREIGEKLAIEEGRTVVTVPESPPAFSQYTATHVKQDGKWKMASVKESAISPSLPQINLKDLEWLIGTWTTEDEGVTLKTIYRWLPGRKFIERTFVASTGKKSQQMGVQIIGIDPLSGDIMSWTFNTDGSHAIGIWMPVDGGWAIESRGVMANGMLTSANNIVTKIDDKGCRWQSVNRFVNGTELPDALEVVSKRD